MKYLNVWRDIEPAVRWKGDEGRTGEAGRRGEPRGWEGEEG